MEQAVFAQQLVGGQAIASQEQLEGFLEQAGCRNILQQRCQLLMGAAVRGLMVMSSLAAKRTARSIRTGSAVAGLGIANELQLALGQVPARPRNRAG